jgi:hypothetical protein
MAVDAAREVPKPRTWHAARPGGRAGDGSAVPARVVRQKSPGKDASSDGGEPCQRDGAVVSRWTSGEAMKRMEGPLESKGPREARCRGYPEGVETPCGSGGTNDRPCGIGSWSSERRETSGEGREPPQGVLAGRTTAHAFGGPRAARCSSYVGACRALLATASGQGPLLSRRMSEARLLRRPSWSPPDPACAGGAPEEEVSS